MPTIDTVVIGAGQAGLAVSRCLAERGVDHVVVERGRVAERWRSERWNSLRLLTPNWMSRLPGWSYTGPDPHGYMTASEVIGYLEGYATASHAPIHDETTVVRVSHGDVGFDVVTTRRSWRAANVIVATGWCDEPAVPAAARNLDHGIARVAPSAYRNPDSLPQGNVLVVGASATGVQLADELVRSGRHVVLAVGSHTRLPRTYRGMDIFWWLDQMGTFDRTIDELPDPLVARGEPSVQLVGRPDHADLDLDTLQRGGVHLAGRLAGIDGQHVRFGCDLAATTSTADTRMLRVLDDIDQHIAATGLAGEVLDREVPSSITPTEPLARLDLRSHGITSVIWATGHRRTYPWLDVPVLDEGGEIRQRRGITPAPGLYVLGQRFQHHRSSNFLDGVGRDAAFVASHIARRHRTAIRPCRRTPIVLDRRP
jgi:putative flavoprotein involved in K+ transport